MHAYSVVVDVYIDLLCPDSRDTYHALTALKKQSPLPDAWELRWHVLALPYHHNSFIVAGGAFLVANNLGPKGFFAYLDRMYTTGDAIPDIEDLILGPSTKDSDVAEVVDLLGERILGAIPALSAEVWAAGMATTDSTISGDHWSKAIAAQKYSLLIACYTLCSLDPLSSRYAMSRLASGTPFTEVNGVSVSADSTLSTGEYQYCTILTLPMHCTILTLPMHCTILTLPMHCTILTLPMHCTVLTLPMHCTILTLPMHCTILTLPMHCTVLPLPIHCTILTLPMHCTIPTLPIHCTILILPMHCTIPR
jgi:hypothetical protein